MSWYFIRYKRGKKRGSIALEAEEKLEAIEMFQEKRLGMIVSIRQGNTPLLKMLEKKYIAFASLFEKRIPKSALIASYRQIGTLLDAGIAINTALTEAILYTESVPLRDVYKHILQGIENGQSLSTSMQPYEEKIGSLSISMFRLGENTGTLSDAILKLADILEQIEDNRRQLVKATRYPVFIIFAMVVAFAVVITMVVPQFQALFAETKMELPMPTRFLIWMEYAIVKYGPFILIGAVGLSAFYSWLYRNFISIKLQTDRYLLKIYIVGTVMNLAMIGRFIYIFDALLEAGIPVLQALDTAISVVDNTWLRHRLEHIPKAIEEGRSLREGFEESELFERITIQMIKAGEEGGALSKMLVKVSKYYNDRYQYIVDNIATMIEPILIMAIAGFVLVLALGIFLPLWSMVEMAGM